MHSQGYTTLFNWIFDQFPTSLSFSIILTYTMTLHFSTLPTTDKCLLPYYGGCSYSRECQTATFQASCGDCLPGFVSDPNNLGGDCLGECI